MKTTRLLLLVAFSIMAMGALRAQYVPLPDKGFGQWLANNGYSACLSGNSTSGWQLDTTCSLVLSATSVDINNDTNVLDITGIHYFKALTSLSVRSDYKFTQLPAVLPATLQYLDLTYSGIQTFQTNPLVWPDIIDLHVDGTPIMDLSRLPSGLQSLWCGFGAPKTIPILPQGLVVLYCTSGGMTTMPTIPMTMRYLECNYNSFSSLPALPDTMEVLQCSNNQLTSLTNLPLVVNDHADFTSNPNLHCLPSFNYIKDLRFDSAAIGCVPTRNVLTSGPNVNNVPLCSTANPYGCSYVQLVYPGDANNDRRADQSDLLHIGLGYGATGPVRSGASIAWVGQQATDWTDTFQGGLNYKFADCNGNGTINAADTLAVVQNFGLYHQKTDGGNDPWRAGAPVLNVRFSKNVVVAGDTLITTISLGDATTPVAALYGLSFQFHFDPLVVDTGKLQFSFVSSWLGTPQNSIHLSRTFAGTGVVKAAITGIDHTSRGGNGTIAEFRSIIITDNINGKNLAYWNNKSFITDVVAVDGQGKSVALNAGADSNQVEYTPNGILTVQEVQLRAVPNPAKGVVNLYSSEPMEAVRLVDIAGREVVFMPVGGPTQLALPLGQVTEGVYWLQVQTAVGSRQLRLMVSR
ncbi:MAG: hypothetical protein U0T84_06010 [Chitinophagales bacterium]